MLAMVYLAIQVTGFLITKIPETNAPPSAMTSLTAVYDKETDTLYSIGGDQIQNDKKISSIYSFSLTTRLWNEITASSEYVPVSTLTSGGYVRSDRNNLIFG